jgi:N-acetylglucosaminyldiphosphoundecaprenol N-acetyl-beta-D-mannosaminyltransferase
MSVLRDDSIPMKPRIDASWYRRWRSVVDKTSRIANESDLQGLLTGLCAPTAPRMVAFVNAHAMNSLAASAAFYDAIRSADVILRDGSGMAALFKLLAQSPGLNLNGTDLIPAIIARFNGRKIALLGTRDPYLRRARAKISLLLAPQSQLIAANGFLTAESYVAVASENRPDLIVLGMGMPKQEAVAVALRSALSFPCLIVCGGAILDFLGARTPRAPLLMRKVGLEWLYRLALEPRRLFARYVLGNPLFLVRALRFARISSARTSSGSG